MLCFTAADLGNASKKRRNDWINPKEEKRPIFVPDILGPQLHTRGRCSGCNLFNRKFVWFFVAFRKCILCIYLYEKLVGLLATTLVG